MESASSGRWKDGGLMTIGQICERECIPNAVCHAKILEKTGIGFGLVQIKRGFGGGCVLARDLADMTLYDVIRATDEELFFSPTVSRQISTANTWPNLPAPSTGAGPRAGNSGTRSCVPQLYGGSFGRVEPGAASVHLNPALPAPRSLYFCP